MIIAPATMAIVVIMVTVFLVFMATGVMVSMAK